MGKILKAIVAWVTIKKLAAIGTAAVATGLTVKRLKKSTT
jgi:hypothetical protein